tara:strand:+ start:277 stop:504 length:228 start_codon:yes stop_codon:yes gene_type:complete
MNLNQKKESLLKELRDANWKVFEEVHDGIAHGDLVGNDDVYYHKALRYVPNHILKKWIRNSKKELKEKKVNKDEN